MGISQALYTGVTGLAVNADSMSVTANNIANANAKGFKRDRAEFEDLISASIAGENAIGRGAKLRDVKTIHTQGGLKVTDSITDVAIQGSGFLIVSNPNTEVQESAGKFYTRVGSLNFDKEGNLVDAGGGRIQGYMAKPDGSLTSRLSDVNIRTSSIPPKQTEKLTLNVNLDSRQDPLAEPFDLNNAEKTSNFNNTVTVFDSHGRGHAATVFYRRVEEADGIRWQWHATVNPKEVVGADPEVEYHEFASGEVAFDKFGNLLTEETTASEVNFANGALQNQVIEFDFGKNMAEEGGNGLNATTSISAVSATVFHSQDGYESGNLKSLSIGLDGIITGSYTNGLRRPIGGIALATFENENGLVKAGRNQFFSSFESGPAKVGNPQTGSRGSIYASALEESNVDLADEFVNMILTQRLFQANSRSITTSDSMVEEVVNLKR
ncbi:MAG: flagellar hook protein FlgE [Oligoflexales bacterium]|nr:flagellar hook protein FlgE [Oligoflexales bacterium]